jgi:hypothetical protein
MRKTKTKNRQTTPDNSTWSSIIHFAWTPFPLSITIKILGHLSMSLNPEKTLVIIFGASEWPDYQDLNYCPNDSNCGNPYQNAANGIRSYFLNDLGIEIDNLLFLFDEKQGPETLIDKMQSFLKKSSQIDHLFFYFVGHGDLYEKSYYLFTSSAKKGNLASFFGVKYLSNTVKQFAGKIKHCYFILDACFAGQADSDLRDIYRTVSTMLFPACHRDVTTRIEGKMPMFTQALLDVLRKRKSPTFSGICKSVRKLLKEHYGVNDDFLPTINDINGMASELEILPYQDYEYDVFISYAEDPGYPDAIWVETIFQPLLMQCLRDALVKRPKIFLAKFTVKEQQRGILSYNYVRQLAQSRCLIPVLSPSHHYLQVAPYECTMLKKRTEKKPGLIWPVSIAGGLEMQQEYNMEDLDCLDCGKFCSSLPKAILKSPRYMKLEDKIRKWVREKELRKVIDSAPPWQKEWLDEKPPVIQLGKPRSYTINPKCW